ncbi:MAG: SLATT domain-containing protein [Chthoniobacter sp.]
MTVELKSTLSSDIDILLTDWFRRVRMSQRAHYECATRCRRINYLLGIPSIILSTIAGTAVFSSLSQNSPATWTRILVGLISVLAAVLASLQTFLGYSQIAEAHSIAGAEYGAARRDLELLKILPPSTLAEVKTKLEAIKADMDRLAKESPVVPADMKTKLDKQMEGRGHSRIFHLPADK